MCVCVCVFLCEAQRVRAHSPQGMEASLKLPTQMGLKLLAFVPAKQVCVCVKGWGMGDGGTD